MDLRSLPSNLDSVNRCKKRRKIIEKELEVDLSLLEVNKKTIGNADEKNCEQMFGQVPIPIGLAGPLKITLSDGNKTTVHLPIATTEGALVASVNRGCKALANADSVQTSSVYHGISRSIAFKVHDKVHDFLSNIHKTKNDWRKIAEETSNHLKLMKYDVDQSENYVYLTIYADTENAMGMNMITIAAESVGNWLEDSTNAELITIAGNIDSDKKPSKIVKERGRGFEATAKVTIDANIISNILNTTPEKLMSVADAKLNHGSKVAGAVSANLHAANVIAALYLATGQDIAHTVEGSLAETIVTMDGGSLNIKTRVPAILVGTIGGGTQLPAQRQCLDMLIKECENMPKRQYLAEVIAASVLAGEISLLAAQATQSLANAHKDLGR